MLHWDLERCAGRRRSTCPLKPSLVNKSSSQHADRLCSPAQCFSSLLTTRTPHKVSLIMSTPKRYLRAPGWKTQCYALIPDRQILENINSIQCNIFLLVYKRKTTTSRASWVHGLHLQKHWSSLQSKGYWRLIPQGESGRTYGWLHTKRRDERALRKYSNVFSVPWVVLKSRLLLQMSVQHHCSASHKCLYKWFQHHCSASHKCLYKWFQHQCSASHKCLYKWFQHQCSASYKCLYKWFQHHCSASYKCLYSWFQHQFSASHKCLYKWFQHQCSASYKCLYKSFQHQCSASYKCL